MPPGDLDRYRQAFLRLQHHLEQGARADRFKPPENFALARVRLGDPDAAPVTGEIVDISPDGMKLALEGGHSIPVGQPCHLDIGADGKEWFELEGLVRWVDSHPLITVIGVQLQSVEVHDGSPP
ncbi:MAG: PilZ domain-containing protein [Cyanobacteriota bacterium]